MKTQEFMQIWNCPTLQMMREVMQEGKVHPLCKTASCSYVKTK
jgi:hypothetical protein